ncbi:hypothetical protein EGW08_023253, partial [Elysia chlorotica]
MDGQEHSTSGDMQAGAAYALINAIDPDTGTSVDPNALPTTDDNGHEPRSASAAPLQPTRLIPSSHLQPHSSSPDEHRSYPNPSMTMSPNPLGSDDGIQSSFGVSSLPQGTRGSVISSARAHADCGYGTFGDHQRKRLNPKGRSRRVVTFELSAEHEIRKERASSSDPNNGAIMKTVFNDEDIRVDDVCLLNKEDVDHMCDDASERVRFRPSGSHWRQILVATLLLCPIGGIASAIFAYKSKRYYDTGQKDMAKRMLRHSDFCLRCATMFGIIFWFLIFL